MHEPFVVIMNGDRDDPLGAFLADNILVEGLLDLHRRGKPLEGFHCIGFGLNHLVATQPVVALPDAVVADVDRHQAFLLRQTLEQGLDGMLVFSAKGATKLHN